MQNENDSYVKETIQFFNRVVFASAGSTSDELHGPEAEMTEFDRIQLAILEADHASSSDDNVDGTVRSATQRFSSMSLQEQTDQRREDTRKSRE